MWKGFHAALKENTNDLSYNTYIKPLTLHKLDEDMGVIYLAAEHDVQLTMLKNNYFPAIEHTLDNILGTHYRVVIKLQSEYEEETSVMAKPKKNPFANEKLINPKYTFDNFIIGDCNKYAHAASVAVAETPGELYNPLFIYGGSGLGKTHLMQAIGVHISKKNPSAKVLYSSAEMFTNEFVKAQLEKKMKQFETKYRKLDALLIDDIQFLEGKEGVQKQFFYVFENLYQNNKQIVVTGDCPPTELKGIEERLRTRFSWNMIADVHSPDYETRVAILCKFADTKNIEVTQDVYDVCCLIADQVKDNIRELEGAFTRVIGFSQLLNEPITVEYAKTVLKDVINDTSKAVEPERIRQTVAAHFNIKVSDLDSPVRKAEINVPRQIAMYICREETDISFPKIGQLFGGRHYSTVMHACDKISEQLKYDETLAENIASIKKKLNIK